MFSPGQILRQDAAHPQLELGRGRASAARLGAAPMKRAEWREGGWRGATEVVHALASLAPAATLGCIAAEAMARGTT